MSTAAPAIAYLEHDEDYAEFAWRRALPRALVELCDDIHTGVGLALDADRPAGVHDDETCDSSDALCTDDGYRWNPTLPILRFP